MGLFGKKKLSEVQAAGQFVASIANGVKQCWPEIAKDFDSTFQTESPILNDQFAVFEFVLAIIAIQIQSLPDILPAHQAVRTREHVLRCVSSPEMGEYPRETINEYQVAWGKSLQRGEVPFYGIASILFDKLGCRGTVEFGEASFVSPTLIMMLSEKVVAFSYPWWKPVAQKYKLVP